MIKLWRENKEEFLMPITIAITGKSGNGKTTLTKSLLYNLRLKYPEKSFLILDNDLNTEFAHTFGQDVRETLYGIQSGKHETKTVIPAKMTRQEYLEWAIEDIIAPIDEYTDLLVSWLPFSKNCNYLTSGQLNNALLKLFKRYDFILFDCEYDIKYLMQLVDCQIDTTLIVTEPSEESVKMAERIWAASEKYSADGLLGIVINKVKKSLPENISQLINEANLKILGVLPYDETLEYNGIRKESQLVNKSVNDLLLSMNLPIME